MHAVKVLQTILAREHLIPSQVSRAIGKPQTFVSTIFNTERMPQTDTLIAILDACGYDLIARNRANDSEHVIEP